MDSRTMADRFPLQRSRRPSGDAEARIDVRQPKTVAQLSLTIYTPNQERITEALDAFRELLNRLGYVSTKVDTL